MEVTAISVTVNRNFEEDAIFGEIFEDTLFLSDLPSWSPIAAFYYTEHPPHVMFTMRHDFEANDNLLRGEALAITAAVLTGLKEFTPEYIYIPVRTLTTPRFLYNFLTFDIGYCLLLHGTSEENDPSGIL